MLLWSFVVFSCSFCPTLCNPMDCCTPCLPVLHHFPEIAQTHVHWVMMHPTISSSVIHFSCLQSFPASQSFLMSQLFAMGGQSTGASAAASECPMNIQDWFPLRLTGWISLQSRGLSKSLFQHRSSKASVLPNSVFFIVQHSHPLFTTGKTTGLTIQVFVCKVMSLLFIMLARFVIAFLPRSDYLLISWLQSLSVSDFRAQENKVVTVSTAFPSIYHEVMGSDAMILVFWMLSFKPAFSLSSFAFIERLFSSSSFSAMRMESSAYLRLLLFFPAILIPAYASFNLALHMIYSAYKLNNQGDNI